MAFFWDVAKLTSSLGLAALNTSLKKVKVTYLRLPLLTNSPTASTQLMPIVRAVISTMTMNSTTASPLPRRRMGPMLRAAARLPAKAMQPAR